MKLFFKRLGLVLLAIVVALALFVFDLLRRGGQFKTLQPHFAGSCTTLPMQASAEDIQIDGQRGIAYLSYLDRRGQIEGKPVLGTVMLLDLNAAQARPRPALAIEPAHFRPHGMSLYRAGDGSERLFVISHPPGQPHTIELFEQSATGAFMPVRTIRDPLLAAPNAIVAVGPSQFYVANDSGAGNRFERMQEILLRRGLSTLLFFDGEKMRVVDSGIESSAGIALSLDGSQLYLSETLGNRIRVYTRKPTSGDLERVETIDIGSAPDNISVAGDGSVWIAAHAVTPALLRHFADGSKPAPTQILRFLPAMRGPARLKEIYLNAGEQISAGSVGAVFNGELLIGSITEHRILRCRLP